ncbi:hypothetical protein R6Q59_010628 [Mikania micrantha]
MTIGLSHMQVGSNTVTARRQSVTDNQTSLACGLCRSHDSMEKTSRVEAPLRPEGGVVFGLKRHDWSTKINKKEKRLAILTALAGAAVNGIMVEEFGDEFGKPSTKDFIEALKR